MRFERWQRMAPRALSLAVLAALLAALWAGLVPAGAAQAQEGIAVWGEPVNLSQSGAASLPYMVVDGNGNLHVLWWDSFDGTKYARYAPETGWSAPQSVRTISGGRVRATNELLPPRSLQVLVDADNFLQVFWTADDGDLLYARKRADFGDWSGSTQLATAPLAWSAFADASHRLHVAVIRTTKVGSLEPGVYYRESTNNGQSWDNMVLVSKSLYFRTLAPERAHVSVSSNGDETFVIWDEPQLGQSTYTRPAQFGTSDEAPLVFEAGDAASGALPQRAHVLNLPDGGRMALWQAGTACELFQQMYDPATATWSLPLQVLDQVGGCPRGVRGYATPDGRLVLVLELEGGGVTMAIWDGTAWSDPLASVISFVNPLTGSTTNLDCLKLVLTGDKVAAIGCDENGDVWVTMSQVGVGELLPALETAWSVPSLLSQASGDAGLPAVTVDPNGAVHALWAEASPNSTVGEFLSYVRGDGTTWTSSPKVLQSPEGKAEHPSLVADRGGMLHAVWSGGLTGQIYYSQSFVRDAGLASGWSEPLALPSLQPVGDWPSLAIDSASGLHLIYVIPLNENRGVYYLYSGDQGQTWTQPQLVFDAVAAAWSMVGEARLALDSGGRLHVMFTRNSLPTMGEAQGVFYARSEDHGLTWSVEAVSAGPGDHPRLVAASADQLHRLWVVRALDKLEVWHEFSEDAGRTWSEPLRALDSTFGVTANIGLATDGNGSVFLSGIQDAVEGSDVLFSGRWDGQVWTDYERVPLGYGATEGSGTSTVVLPQGLLGAFYRVQAITAGGAAKYAVGYSQRPVTIGEVTALPTFTPPPPPTHTPAPTLAPTATATALVDLRDTPAPTMDNNFWIQVGGILSAMLLVSVLAVWRLVGGRR